jgi:hypothetical protein
MLLAIGQISCGSSFPEDRSQEAQLTVLDRFKPFVAQALSHR